MLFGGFSLSGKLSLIIGRMDQILMWIIAISALLGGLDCIIGNRFGLGRRFEEGFSLIGPLMFGMLGILSLTPVLAEILKNTAAPLLVRIGLDPSVLAGILPIDMGGYPLALEITADPGIGIFSAVIITATFGCTVLFTIPVGFGMIKPEKRESFILGTMYGLVFLPVSLVMGGLFSGLGLLQTLWQSLPVLLLAFLLALVIRKKPAETAKIFMVFARIIRAVSVIGIIAGLTEYLIGYTLIPGIMPFREALLSSALCGILLVGCMPLAEILNRLLRRPLRAAASRAGLEEGCMTGMLLTLVSVTASLGVMHDMREESIQINAAFLVSAAALFGPHLGICAVNAPEMVAPMIIAKLAGGFSAAVFTLLMIRRVKTA